VLEGETWYQETETEGLLGENRAFGFGVNTPNNTGWRGGVSARQVEDNFRPAVGFVNETGIRDYQADAGYRYRFRDAFLRSVYGGIEASRVERLDTGLLDRQDAGIRLNFEASNQSRAVVNLSTNEENIPADFTIYTESNGSRRVVIPAGNYQWQSLFVGARTGDSRKVSAFMGVNTGEYYDGERTSINTDFNWRPSEHFRLALAYSANNVSLPDGQFVVRIGTLRAQYVFSSTLAWTNLIQYDNVSEALGFNSRLHWIPQAGREGFIVLNHSLTDVDKDGAFHSTGADIAMKFNYTWRF
jgi:hypothetical protein